MSELPDNREPGQEGGHEPLTDRAAEASVATSAATPAEPPSADDMHGPTAPDQREKRSRTRRRLLTAGASVLVLASVAAGVTVTAVTVEGADRAAPPAEWEMPEAATKSRDAATKTGLSGMLVPFTAGGYAKGPDDAEFGGDTELSGARATAVRKQSIAGLPKNQRRLLEKQIERQHISGLALRTYSSSVLGGLSTPEYKGDAVSIEVTLVRMENRQALHRAGDFQRAFVHVLKGFRKGPTIKGHKDALCFRPTTEKKAELDMIFCSAVQGDVLVSITALTDKPADTGGVAAFVAEQLDRVQSPGEAV